MDAVLRALFIYIFLLLLIRITGRRTLSQMSSFDFVLLLIIGESTQQALLGQDYSITNAAIVITTLLAVDVLLSLLKRHSPTFAKWTDGVPMILVQDGQPLRDRMDKARISEDDILQSAPRLQGLEKMDQIRLAVLESTGSITIIPKS